VDEETLRAVTIGELKPYATKIVIEDYNPAWPTWFEWDRTNGWNTACSIAEQPRTT
jgi:hypothetical protein